MTSTTTRISSAPREVTHPSARTAEARPSRIAKSSGFRGGPDAFKNRQLVFILARQLAQAQFVQADRSRTERLWQEVAALEIDPDRMTALLYGGVDLDDTEAMEEIDRPFRQGPPRRRWGWLGGGQSSAPRPRRRGAQHQ